MAHDLQMPSESILAIDCGSTTTQVTLFGLVGGEFRFIARGVAPSSVEPPWNDVMRGWSSVSGRITSWREGRRLSST